MSDFTVIVTYTPGADPAFSYQDSNGNDAGTLKHCMAGKVIRWQLTGGPFLGVMIQFDPTDRLPFDPGDNPSLDPKAGILKWNTDYKFNSSNKHRRGGYKYSVFILDANNHLRHDDPLIEFDDGSLLGSGAPELTAATVADSGKLVEKIAQSADKAADAFFSRLKDVVMDEPKRFFPHGINDVEVTVGFGDAKIEIIVKGPNS